MWNLDGTRSISYSWACFFKSHLTTFWWSNKTPLGCSLTYYNLIYRKSVHGWGMLSCWRHVGNYVQAIFWGHVGGVWLFADYLASFWAVFWEVFDAKGIQITKTNCKQPYLFTHGSMNSLFSYFFRTFWWVILGVWVSRSDFEGVWRSFWGENSGEFKLEEGVFTPTI